MAGFRLTTKVQVSGWRFLLRRVEHAIVRRDTAAYPGLLSDLEQVHGDLERVRQGLR